MKTALVTGASKGLGRASSIELARRGWALVITARGRAELERVAEEIRPLTTVVALPGDIAHGAHRTSLATAAARLGGAHLLVNNASTLGPSPQPAIESYPLDELRRVYEVNVVAPLALSQLLAPQLREHSGVIVNISSDAAVEPYAGWGGYGSSKAALDQVTAILAAEQPGLHVFAFDPGDMRTDMHQQAFPGEDISDRPSPDTVVPELLRLVETQPPSGRYRADQLRPVHVGA